TPSERWARAFLEEQGVAEAFARVESVHGTPEKVLQALARERDFDGLLLGRAAPSDRTPTVALGRVPRRILRGLELPTVVVPPDEVPPDAPGPIVVGIAPTPESLEAAGFAVLLGEELELPVVLVHVVTPARPVATAGVLSLEPRDPSMSS